MFAKLRRNEESPMKDLPVEDPLALVTAAVAAIKKPNRLLLAEKAMMAARSGRATIAAELRGAIAEPVSRVGREREIRNLELELSVGDARVNESRAVVDAARAEWSPAVKAALEPYRAEAAARIVAAINEIETAAQILRVADKFLACAGLDPSPGRPPDMQHFRDRMSRIARKTVQE